MDKNTYANLPGVTDWKWRFVFAWVFSMVGLMSLISIMIFGNWMRAKSVISDVTTFVSYAAQVWTNQKRNVSEPKSSILGPPDHFLCHLKWVFNVNIFLLT